MISQKKSDRVGATFPKRTLGDVTHENKPAKRFNIYLCNDAPVVLSESLNRLKTRLPFVIFLLIVAVSNLRIDETGKYNIDSFN